LREQLAQHLRSLSPKVIHLIPGEHGEIFGRKRLFNTYIHNVRLNWVNRESRDLKWRCGCLFAFVSTSRGHLYDSTAFLLSCKPLKYTFWENCVAFLFGVILYYSLHCKKGEGSSLAAYDGCCSTAAASQYWLGLMPATLQRQVTLSKLLIINLPIPACSSADSAICSGLSARSINQSINQILFAQTNISHLHAGSKISLW